jgi:hypothetical protein
VRIGEDSLTYPAREGRVVKHCVAVLPFRDQSSQEPGLADAATDVMTTELLRSGCFIVVERSRLKEVFHEQELEGVVTPETLARAGEALGADYVLVGSVTEWACNEENQQFSTPGYSYVPSVPISRRKSSVQIGLEGRLVDTTSGKVVTAGAGHSSREESGVTLGGGPAKRRETFGKLVRFAVVDLTRQLVSGTENLPWEGRVAAVTDNDVFISGGASVGLRVGDHLDAFARGSAIYAPESGQLIGYERSAAGTLEIAAISEKMATARAASGQELKIGDIVRLAGTGSAGLDADAIETPRAPSDTVADRTPANAPPQAKFCSQCGEKLTAAAKFCPKCGTKIE